MPRSTVTARTAERSRLRLFVEDRESARGAVLVLRGPAGIGKTALAGWAAQQAQARGWLVHHVAATAAHLEPPLGLWTRLAAAAGADGIAVGDTLLDGAAEGLSSARRYGMVLELLRGLGAGSAPVLLMLEDLHEVDASSLLVLLQLLPALPGARITVLATTRASAAHPDPVGRDVLQRLLAATQLVELGPLEVEETAAVTAALAPRNGVPGLEEWCRAVAPALHRHSGGNPLLLQGLLAALEVHRGQRPDAAAVEAAGREVTVELAAERLLGRLPAPVVETLAVAAALGDAGDLAALEVVLERGAEADLELAVAAGVLLGPRATPRFSHPSYREAADRHGITTGQRHRIATLLRRRGGAGELVLALHHLAEVRDTVPAGELRAVAEEAAARCALVGDHLGAARALDLAVTAHRQAAGPEVVPLLLQAAEAFHLAGDRVAAWERARAAAAPGRGAAPRQLARAALLLARGQEFAEDLGEPVALLRTAAAVLPEDDELLPQLLATQAHLTLFTPLPDPGTTTAPGTRARWTVDVAGSRRLADRACALPSAGEHRAQVSLVWRETHTDPLRHDDRRAAGTAAIAAATSDELRGRAELLAALDALEGADRSGCDAHLDRARTTASRTGDLDLRWRVALVEAALARGSGHLDVAVGACAHATAAGNRAAEPGTEVASLVQAVLLDVELDVHGPALTTLLEAGDSVLFPSMQAGMALGHALRGQRDRALEVLGPLVDEVVADTGREAAWLCTVTLLADAVATLGERPLAEPLTAVLEPVAHLIGVDLIDGLATTGCAGRALGRLLALQGRHNAAEAAFEAALARDRDAGLALYVLRGRVDQLAARQARGLHLDAEVVQEVIDEAHRRGARAVQARAASLRLSAGAPQLTDRQQQVLAGLAAGRTYRQIAAATGFAHGTIRKEVLALYRLLAVNDRAAALAAAEELGLLPAP